MKTNDSIQKAFDHVRQFHSEIKIMVINYNGMWCFMDENFNAPVFHPDIDTNILQLAVDSAHDTYGLPYIYEEIIQI